MYYIKEYNIQHQRFNSKEHYNTDDGEAKIARENRSKNK